ncbi:hypothetical protein AVEN_200619-1 [Araneus ventricosus]|uniref:Uncharacterized protein n=1 Tax=Araneus ventricosus TaxID=182803 RepID=A0A4Y2T098_ARAVE|nr:hypothetical protein AVEN_200619-1 [Araneus ventricosus]
MRAQSTRSSLKLILPTNNSQSPSDQSKGKQFPFASLGNLSPPAKDFAALPFHSGMTSFSFCSRLSSGGRGGGQIEMEDDKPSSWEGGLLSQASR